MMNILVTGGAGFVGSHLTDELVRQGHTVRIIDSLVEQVHGGRPPEHLNRHAEFVHADLCDADAVKRALDGVEVVYHQAAEVGIAQSMYEIVRYVKGNDLGTAVLLEEMVKRPAQFKKLVVASSHSVYGEGTYHCESCKVDDYPALRSDKQMAAHDWDFKCKACGGKLVMIGTPEDKPQRPTSVYAINKQVQEQYCLTIGRAYNIPTVAFRYFNIYGTRQALSNPYTGVCAIFSSRLMNNQAPTIYEDGDQARDFVHVSDIVRANLLTLETDEVNYQSINLGTGKATSIKKIALLLAEKLGKHIEPDIPGKYREGDIRQCVADVSKARDLLDFEPRIAPEDGLDELLTWLVGQNPVDRAEMANAELAARSLVK